MVCDKMVDIMTSPTHDLPVDKKDIDVEDGELPEEGEIEDDEEEVKCKTLKCDINKRNFENNVLKICFQLLLHRLVLQSDIRVFLQ